MSEEFSPRDLKLLVEVPTEDTMTEFYQMIKFAKNVKTGKIWMFVDRVHKQNRDLSKPTAYVQLNNAQLLMLAQAIASVFISEEKYITSLDALMEWIKAGVKRIP
ncbi:hypothetical protein [Thermofilum sp.]|uniref:hypothetical protein n=1 Tax=Thermofilum sp. TaxID=1961369 RepID=UPI003176CA96